MTIQRIKLRRGTAAAWTSANPTLAAGEPGYETDTGKHKIGNGATAWASLAYVVPTAAALAADSAFTSQYGTSIWIPAGAHSVLLGSPAVQTGAPYSDAYSMDAAADEGVGSSVILPSGWATFAVDLHWANAGAGSGDVKWLLCGQEVSEAETINGLTVLASATQTARAQNVEDVFTLASPLTNTGGRWLFMAYRSGGDGADTLGNDAAFHGFNIRRLS